MRHHENMSFIKAVPLASLDQNGLAEFIHQGEPYAICRVGDEVHAIEGVCPHRGASLAEGALHGKMVVCPWHAWEFDCTTGEFDMNSAIQVKTFRTKVEGDHVLIDLLESGN